MVRGRLYLGTRTPCLVIICQWALESLSGRLAPISMAYRSIFGTWDSASEASRYRDEAYGSGDRLC